MGRMEEEERERGCLGVQLVKPVPNLLCSTVGRRRGCVIKGHINITIAQTNSITI